MDITVRTDLAWFELLKPSECEIGRLCTRIIVSRSNSENSAQTRPRPPPRTERISSSRQCTCPDAVDAVRTISTDSTPPTPPLPLHRLTSRAVQFYLHRPLISTMAAHSLPIEEDRQKRESGDGGKKAEGDAWSRTACTRHCVEEVSSPLLPLPHPSASQDLAGEVIKAVWAPSQLL
uniref:Uncharacterized protein n=1 Tax=Knipowitschia caucasica TaxID=637954 RepID=A0AAV2J4M5_KNICA